MLNTEKIFASKSDLQLLLNTFDLEETIDFNSMTWELRNKNTSNDRYLTIEFSPLYKMDTSGLGMSPDELIVSIKTLLVVHSQGFNPVNHMRTLYNGLCLLISFMIESRISVLAQNNLEKFIDFYLSNRWFNKPYPCLSPISYPQFRRLAYYFCQFNQTLIAYDKKPFVRAFRRSQIVNAAKVILQSKKYNLSFSDWYEGGTNNTLGLDIGKYYITYSSDLFENNLVYALALKRTIECADSIIKDSGLGLTCKDKLYCVYSILSGVALQECQSKRAYDLQALGSLKANLESHFRSYVLHFNKKYLPYTRKGLKAICLATDIDTSESNFALIQNMFESDRQGYKNKKSSLRNSSNKLISINKLKQIVSSISENISESIFLPTAQFYLDLGIPPRSPGTPNLVHSFLRTWVHAGRVTFLAYTGWRASECGFSTKSITIEENNDILDGNQYQFRYFIDWFVFKTHGNNTQIREITLSSWVIVDVLAQYFGSKETSPALFKDSNSNDPVHKFSNILYTSVISIWTMFVQNYRPFIALRLLIEQEAIGVDSECHAEIQKQLKSKFSDKEITNITSDQVLRNAYEKVNSELEIVDIVLNPKSGTNENKNVLSGYQEYLKNKKSYLPSSLCNLLDNVLSDYQKSIIISTDSKDALSALSSQIRHILKKHLTLPSPHAIRHMWAEAVYRRFDGDVGWLIRSQFKHVSPNMWLSYIKYKSPRALDEIKYNVLSSLTENWLRNEGSGYSGKIHHLLISLSKRTEIITLQKLDKETMDSIYEGVENIQSNPWGYCILRQRTRHLAKCQEFGEPKPGNASPEFCVGCANNITNSHQLEYLILKISTHIAILKEAHELPKAYIKQSIEFLKNVRKHIITQSPNHPALNDINEVLESC